MELRNCGTKHFIRTIKNGVILKACNIFSNQRPAIRFKSLKDIYESEDAKRLQKPHSGLAFDHQQVKDESPCFLVADRTLHEIKPEPDEFPCADDDLGSGLDDDTTLKQLKKQLLSKKRKHIPINDNLQQDNAIEKAAQDESDLNELLINWKTKRSKISKATCKHKFRAISSSTSDLTIKSEENLASEWSPQVIRVKIEVPDAEQLEYQNKASSGDASSVGYNEVPIPGQKMVLNKYDREPLLCVNRYGNCVTNEISYNHLEDVVPLSIICQRDEMSVQLETSETASRDPDVPSMEIKKQREIQDSHSWREPLSEDPDLFSNSRSSLSVDDMPEERSISCTQVPDMATDGCKGLRQECNSVPFEDRTEADFLNEPNDCQSSLDKNCCSNMVPIEHLKSMEDTISDKEQPSACSIARNELNSEGHIEDEVLKAVDQQNTALTTAEHEAHLDNMLYDSAETVSIPEANQPPESLLSTREAISPSPQEQLQLVINSDEICNDLNQNIVLECREKLFDNQTEKKESSLRSDIHYDDATVNHRRNEMVGQRKVTISPRRILRKSQIAKGNLDGPRFSRMLPNLSTGCTSVQGCSEGAIAFTQRQMRDMETLAEKLMNELKSMKDIVEQKLLFEAYRNASLKNDADEVKTIIKNTTRVEEIARRWVSMMARDCTRFCKIMKMTPDSTPASKEFSPREGRKIRFADEAGGELCHIKFFDDVIAAPGANSDDMKPRRHSV